MCYGASVVFYLNMFVSFLLSWFLMVLYFIWQFLLLVDADVRLARRIRRDTVERGRDVNSVLEQVSLSIPHFSL